MQCSQGTASEPRGTVWGTCSDRAGGALRHRLGLSSSICAPSSCGLRLPPFLSYFIYQKNPYRHDCQTIFRCGESTRFVRQISLGETLQHRGELNTLKDCSSNFVPRSVMRIIFLHTTSAGRPRTETQQFPEYSQLITM